MLILGVKGRTSLHLLGCTMQYIHAPAIRHTRAAHLGEREPRRQIAADAQRRELNEKKLFCVSDALWSSLTNVSSWRLDATQISLQAAAFECILCSNLWCCAVLVELL